MPIATRLSLTPSMFLSAFVSTRVLAEGGYLFAG